MVLNIIVKPIITDQQIEIPLQKENFAIENLPCHSFESNLKPLIKWMNLIGIPPPPTDGIPRWPYYLFRIFAVSVFVVVDVWLVVHIFLNASSVSGAYSIGASSTALAWNFIVDGCNFSLYEIIGYGFLITLTRPETWRNLIMSTNELDNNWPLPQIYTQCRTSLINLMIFLGLSV